MPASVAALEHWLSGRSDADLLHDLDHPADSFAIFYRRHVNALLRFAASRGADADAAADVVAETFFAALRGRRSYRVQNDSARPWLLGIAVRKLADAQRRHGSELRRDERLRADAIALTDADRHSYDELLSGADQRGLDALADLPETQQQAIRARVVEDRSYAAVAQALGLSEPAARQHVSRGLAALRRTLRKTQ